MTISRRIAIAAVLVATALTNSNAIASRKRPLTPEDAIATVRFMDNRDLSDSHGVFRPISVSPDGKRFVLRLVRGDVKRNSVLMEIVSGRLDSLDAAAHLKSIASFFSTGLGAGTDQSDDGPDTDTAEYENPVHWIDNHRVSFLWSDAKNINQVVVVNLVTHDVRYATRSSSQVRDYDVAPNGTLLYTAAELHSQAASEKLLREGFVVDEHADAAGLLNGDVDGYTSLDRDENSEFFLQRPSEPRPQKILLDGTSVSLSAMNDIHFSPDGRFALVSSTAHSIPANWNHYLGFWHAFVQEAREYPRSSGARRVNAVYVVNVLRETSRRLWPALWFAKVERSVWSPDSRSILLAPAFLPPQGADADGLAGVAVAVVNVATGKYSEMPEEFDSRGLAGLYWRGVNDIEIDTSDGTLRGIVCHYFKRTGNQWIRNGVKTVVSSSRSPVRIEVRQNLNLPPRLYAVDNSTGRARMILDPNPHLARDFTLGRVKNIHGTLVTGEKWTALLYYPVHFRAGKRYPLVIQSQYGGFEPRDEFSLYGYGVAPLGPPEIAPYPGQTLANRDIAVLQLWVGIATEDSPEAGRAYQAAFETVAEQLIKEGLVNRRKVGLVGFSINGYFVEYTLTHTTFPFASAIAADYWDASYLTTALSNWNVEASLINGAAPFGDGLKTWLKNAPGFNVEKIAAPLRIVDQSEGWPVGILYEWESYSRLRYLHKPVEFYVVPDFKHGAHDTQNPRQILAEMNGSIDWFSFWLQGYEDRNPLKAQQYVRWRALRARLSP